MWINWALQESGIHQERQPQLVSQRPDRSIGTSAQLSGQRQGWFYGNQG